MIKIANRKIGKKFRPFIVAEMSGNHNQSIKNAIKIIDKASECGVDAVKIQTYTADTLTINSDKDDFKIKDKNSLWKNQTLYQLYKKAYTPWEWHKKFFYIVRRKILYVLVVLLTKHQLIFLENYNVPAYKIASFEINNIPLIEKIAKLRKPMVISTGLANLKEINEVVKTAYKNGCKKIILLKCTSSYPAEPEDSNIATIKDLINRFHCEVGISDHTKGIGVSIAAISQGATFIEKHFTLDRKKGGVDAEFSLEPDEMRQLVIESKEHGNLLVKFFMDLPNLRKILLNLGNQYMLLRILIRIINLQEKKYKNNSTWIWVRAKIF